MSEPEYPSLLRSEAMSLVQLYIPSELAHATVEELGEMKAIQFKDLNGDANNFQRTYVGEIRRLDEMDRRLTYLTNKIRDDELRIRPYSETQYMLEGRSGPQIIDELDPKLAEHEERVSQMQGSYETLGKRMAELEEAKQVLRETASFFMRSKRSGGYDDVRGVSFDEPTAPLLGDVMEQGLAPDSEADNDVEFVAGTIDRTRMATFERVLWRVLRGNLYMNYAEIEQTIRDVSKPKSEGGEVRKNVFLIFAHGKELLDKIRKIAESMGGTVYPIDSNADKREDALREVTARIEDLQSVLQATNNTRRNELAKISDSVSAWWAIVRKEKIIYHTMNLFQYDSGRRTLIAEGWVATRDIHGIQIALRNAAESTGAQIPPILHELHNAQNPPTFIRTNRFTEGFQSIIDAYGMASYQEVNPGLFAIITFPFLFAVMFGDIGHGIIMFCAALAFVMMEKKLMRGSGNEIIDQFFHGRYIVLLMGIFAVYTGFLYNDVFSLSIDMGGSGWDWPEPEGSVTAKSNGGVYPFGLDPAWHGADNALVFTNSLKMKMSIIMGVVHMTFALCLQIPNHLHFKTKKFILVEWLPQFLFLECIFGYLVLMVLYKWTTNWEAVGLQPPNLLNMLIYMFLSPGSIQDDARIYSGQALVQAALLLVAVISVPVMLCGKPYMLYREHKQHKEQGYEAVGQRSEEDGDMNGGEMEHEGEHEEFELGDVIIHQVIHTIEFCLGAISNTASYLRLWALSLAHAQLSEVLWSMSLKRVIGMEGPVGIIAMVVIFGFWFVLTCAILVLMEGLSAFLHAMRLHWVEANGKHFEGNGTVYEPINFSSIDEGFIF